MKGANSYLQNLCLVGKPAEPKDNYQCVSKESLWLLNYVRNFFFNIANFFYMQRVDFFFVCVCLKVHMLNHLHRFKNSIRKVVIHFLRNWKSFLCFHFFGVSTLKYPWKFCSLLTIESDWFLSPCLTVRVLLVSFPQDMPHLLISVKEDVGCISFRLLTKEHKGTQHIPSGHWTYGLREINTNGLERSEHSLIAWIREGEMLLLGKWRNEPFLKWQIEIVIRQRN